MKAEEEVGKRNFHEETFFSKAASLPPENVYEDVKMAKGKYIMRTGGVWNWVMA